MDYAKRTTNNLFKLKIIKIERIIIIKRKHIFWIFGFNYSVIIIQAPWTRWTHSNKINRDYDNWIKHLYKQNHWFRRSLRNFKKNEEFSRNQKNMRIMRIFTINQNYISRKDNPSYRKTRMHIFRSLGTPKTSVF